MRGTGDFDGQSQETQLSYFWKEIFLNNTYLAVKILKLLLYKQDNNDAH